MKNFLFFILALVLASCNTSKLTFSPSAESATLKEDVYILASDEFMGRETGTEGEQLAANYIIDEFRQCGITALPSVPNFKQEFPFTANPHFNAADGHPVGQSKGYNVIGVLSNNSDRYIVVGAHYDHLGMGGPFSREPNEKAVHNGADDNASGVAAMFSIARQLQKAKLKHNIIFVGFSGEEFGLWGSKHFVNNPPVGLDKIDFMINMDMIGRLNENKDLVVSGTGTTNAWHKILDKANDDVNLNLVRKESGSGPSDHSSFYRKGIPVLAFFTGQHNDYHKPEDDADKLNYGGMADISHLISKTIVLADKEDSLPFMETKEEERKMSTFKVSLGVMPDYVYQGTGLRIDGVTNGRPASKSGIKSGDIILKFGEFDIDDIYKYMEALAAHKSGDIVDVVVDRDGEKLTFKVEL